MSEQPVPDTARCVEIHCQRFGKRIVMGGIPMCPTEHADPGSADIIRARRQAALATLAMSITASFAGGFLIGAMMMSAGMPVWIAGCLLVVMLGFLHIVVRR